MTRLLPLIDYYEQSDTAFVPARVILPDIQEYRPYLTKYEEEGILKVQWTKMPKIKLTGNGYEILKAS
jgi:hypothetical protein